MLDIAAINAWILYRKSNNKGKLRKKLLVELIYALRQKQIESSPEIPFAAYNQLPTRKQKKCREFDGCYMFSLHYLQGTKLWKVSSN